MTKMKNVDEIFASAESLISVRQTATDSNTYIVNTPLMLPGNSGVAVFVRCNDDGTYCVSDGGMASHEWGCTHRITSRLTIWHSVSRATSAAHTLITLLSMTM